MERAPDGRILIACPNQVNVLHVINNPNQGGVACDIVQHGIILDAHIAISMPHFPNYNLGPLGDVSCDSTVLTSEVQAVDPDIYVYPNPATEQLTIELEEVSDGLRIELYNMIGQKVKSIELDERITLTNVSDLEFGMYTLLFVRQQSVRSMIIVIGRQ
jgi:hypothetical protein